MAGETAPQPDRTVPLDIANRLSAQDREGMSGVTLVNVPPGAVLSAGVADDDGSWVLSPEDLAGLVLSPPPDWGGDITLTVRVTVQAGAEETVPTTLAFGVRVPFAACIEETPESEPDLPEPEVEVSEPVIAETDEGIVLELDLGLADAMAPETMDATITGVSGGARLSAGTDTGNGIWTLNASELEGLVLYPAPGNRGGNQGKQGDLFLGLAVSSKGDVIATGSLTVSLEEEQPLPPEPEPEPEPVFEPAPEIPVLSFPPANAGGLAPVAYWKLDETASGVARDEMGGHDGQAFGAGVDATAVFGGIDNYIEVSHTDDMALPAGALTAWVYAFAVGGGVIAGKGDFQLRVQDSRLEFCIGSLKVDGGFVGANDWNQVTVTWGPDGMKTFLNGQLTGAVVESGSLVANTSPWTFGAHKDGGVAGNFLQAELDDIAIYAEQLDTDSVDALSRIGVEGLMTGEVPPEIDDIAEDSGVDSPLNFDSIQAEAEGPESLATIDTLALLSGNFENDEPGLAEPPPEPAPEDDLEGDLKDGAITISDGGELIVENVEKLEW